MLFLVEKSMHLLYFFLRWILLKTVIQKMKHRFLLLNKVAERIWMMFEQVLASLTFNTVIESQHNIIVDNKKILLDEIANREVASLKRAIATQLISFRHAFTAG